MKYTLVQHTGFTVGGDATFFRAVESLAVGEPSAKAAVKAGGVVFDDYVTAEDAAMLVNYPHAEYGGLTPMARGRFLRIASVNHLHPLYVPTKEDADAIDGLVTS